MNTPSVPIWAKSLHRGLLYVIDFALASIIFIAPLFFGGRYAVGRLVFVSFVCVAALAWIVRQCLASRAPWPKTGMEVILAAGLLLVLLQLTPLSSNWLARLAPQTQKILPLWSASAETGAKTTNPTGADGATATEQGTAKATLGTWSRVSLTPAATAGGLAMYVAYAMLFLVTVARVRQVEDVERLLRWLALAAIGMAAFGIVQYLAGNGKFLWLYEHPFRSTRGAAKGSFINQNHFAHFLVLGTAPLLWWLHRLMRKDRRSTGKNGESPFQTNGNSGTTSWGERRQLLFAGVACGLGIVAFASLLSFSRGGVGVLLLATVTCVGIYVWRKLIDGKTLIVLGTACTLIGGAVLIHGYSPLANKLQSITQADSMNQLSDGRQDLWAALGKAIPDFALVGSGIGSHREIYPMYLDGHGNTEFTHAENGYLQVLLEAGIPGFVLLLAGIAIVGYWCVATLAITDSRRIAACMGAIAAVLLASVIHSLVDFVWYIPACMSLTVILAACACRLLQLARNTREAQRAAKEQPAQIIEKSAQTAATLRIDDKEASPVPPPKKRRSRSRREDVTVTDLMLPRFVWGAAMVVILAGSVMTIQNRLGPALASSHWNAYLAMSLQSERENRLNSIAGKVSTSKPAEKVDRDSLIEPMMSHLEKVVAADPNNARAHMRLASLCIYRFELEQRHAENAMPLSQIRDAVFASKFPSMEEQNRWLSRAIGENCHYLQKALFHVHQGLQGCPLQGEGYVYLAELGFLEGRGNKAKEAQLAQAMKLRPHNDLVLFAVGREAAMAMDVPRAIACWKKPFQRNPRIRAQIIAMYGHTMPPAFFVQHFNPDLDGMKTLYRFYRNEQMPIQLQQFGQYYARKLEESARDLADQEKETRHLANQEQPSAGEQWRKATRVYRDLGDLDRAVACAELAVQASPNSYAVRRELAMCFVAKKRYDEAIKQLQWCLSRNPDDSALRQALRLTRRDRWDSMAKHQKPGKKQTRR